MRWPWEVWVEVRCPECQTTEPGLKLLDLSSQHWVGASGRVVSQVTGCRVACQKCPCVYSIGPRGTFRQHPLSMPASPGPMREGPPEGHRSPETADRESPRSLMPVPRERPPL